MIDFIDGKASLEFFYEEQYMMVYDYMHSESIDSLMISKPSSPEFVHANEKITHFSKLSREESRKKFERNK